MMAERVGEAGKIYAFEPVMHRPLEMNIRVNGCRNILAVSAAVGDHVVRTTIDVRANCIDSRIGDAFFTLGAEQAAAAQAKFGGKGLSDAHATRLDVELTTVDRFVQTHDLQQLYFIKVDIEGAEELAMRGSRQTVERFRPSWTIASPLVQQGDKLVMLPLPHEEKEQAPRHGSRGACW